MTPSYPSAFRRSIRAKSGKGPKVNRGDISSTAPISAPRTAGCIHIQSEATVAHSARVGIPNRTCLREVRWTIRFRTQATHADRIKYRTIRASTGTFSADSLQPWPRVKSVTQRTGPRSTEVPVKNPTSSQIDRKPKR